MFAVCCICFSTRVCAKESPKLRTLLTWTLAGSTGIGNCTCPSNTWLDVANNQCVACADSTSSAGVCLPPCVLVMFGSLYTCVCQSDAQLHARVWVWLWRDVASGSTSVHACVCNADFYKALDGSCSVCPDSSTSLRGKQKSHTTWGSALSI